MFFLGYAGSAQMRCLELMAKKIAVAPADVFDYIERFYNPRRRHSTLGLVSPDEFEKLNQA